MAINLNNRNVKLNNCRSIISKYILIQILNVLCFLNLMGLLDLVNT